MSKKFVFTLEVDFDDMVEANNEFGGDATEDDYTVSNARDDMNGFLDGFSVNVDLIKAVEIEEEDDEE